MFLADYEESIVDKTADNAMITGGAVWAGPTSEAAGSVLHVPEAVWAGVVVLLLIVLRYVLTAELKRLSAYRKAKQAAKRRARRGVDAHPKVRAS